MDDGEEWVGVATQHAVGSAVHFVASSHQVDGDLMVALERWAISVKLVAVGFDHDPLSGPEEVNEVILHEHIDGGQRQTSFPA